MTNSIEELEHAKLLFVIGSNTTEAHPVISYYIKRAVKKGAILIVCDPRKIDLTRWATHHVQHKVGTDVALMNGLMNEVLRNGWEAAEFIQKHTENFEALEAVVKKYSLKRVSKITGVSEAQLKQIARLIGNTKPMSLVYTLGITEHTTGTENVMTTANLQMLLGNMGVFAGGVNPLRGQNNVQGACDIGVLPNVYHNYQKVDDPKVRKKFEKGWGRPGLSDKVGLKMPAMFQGMVDGTVKAFLCHGENVVQTEPNEKHTIRALETVDFMVSLDIFETITTPYADVILPCTAWGESNGTYTNSERRIQRSRPALKPPGECKEPWWIMNEIGKRMGFDMGFRSSHGVWEDMRKLATSYAGITWQRCEELGIQWPAPTTKHPGTPYLHKDGNFARGRGLFNPAEWKPQAERPSKRYPFVLSTGRRLYHYHTGTQTHNSVGMDDILPEELVELSPVDARALKIKNRQYVWVISRRGKVKMRAWVTDRSPRGVVWSSFHFAEAHINKVTNSVYDPLAGTAEYKACAVRIEPAD